MCRWPRVVAHGWRRDTECLSASPGVAGCASKTKKGRGDGCGDQGSCGSKSQSEVLRLNASRLSPKTALVGHVLKEVTV